MDRIEYFYSNKARLKKRRHQAEAEELKPSRINLRLVGRMLGYPLLGQELQIERDYLPWRN